jgi:anti-sigma regulatory factor (Ser/Thr protein kinase)
VKSGSKSHHYPVSVVGDHTIRIELRSPQDRIQPHPTKAITLLSDRGIKILPLSKEINNMTLTSSDKRQMEDRILFLAQRGNVMAAIKLARQAFGMNLTDAKKFVEELIQ